jgi:DNA end-binding protein Ku
MLKGYEFEKGKFVLFTPAELKALQEGARESIDIVSFIPAGAVDPIYYDKAYLLAPDKRGERSYSLLRAALERSGRCALAKWAWRSKQYVVQVRPAAGGLVLQQLLYADEVRSPADLDIPLAAVGDGELELALRLIEQGSQDAYDPHQFVDEEKQRILAAVERKIAGREIVATSHEPAPGAQVIDLMEALRASLRPAPAAAEPKRRKAARSAKGAQGSARR